MRLTWAPRNRDLTLLDAFGLAGMAGFLAARVLPVMGLMTCPFRAMTGWPCLSCGLTRVADHMAHFRFAEAWTANPLGAVLAVFFYVCALAAPVHLFFRTRTPEVALAPGDLKAVRWALGVVLAANYAWVVYASRVLGRA